MNRLLFIILHLSFVIRCHSASVIQRFLRRWSFVIRHSAVLAAALLATAVTGARAADPAAPTPEEAALLKADAAFCQLCMDKGMAESFTSFAAEEAVMLIPGEGEVKGRAGIRQAMTGTEDIKLTWKPSRAEVARSGELGYTYGIYRMSGIDGAVIRTGQYTTVWKKQADGGWKFVLDVGNQNPVVPTK